MLKRIFPFFLLFIFVLTLPESVAFAEGPNFIEFKLGGEEGNASSVVRLFLLVAFLSLAPSLFLMFTCFPYVIIVLGMTRQGLGTMNLPPNQILIGLAFFITIFVMYPVFEEVYNEALVPMDKGELETTEAISKAEKPIKEFMLNNTKEKNLELMLKLRREEKPNSFEEVSIFVVVPSYTLTQIQNGLTTGMYIVGSFVFMDIFIGTVLMFMGMMMLPPQIISLPFKILMFVYIGGYTKIVEVILRSINF